MKNEAVILQKLREVRERVQNELQEYFRQHNLLLEEGESIAVQFVLEKIVVTQTVLLDLSGSSTVISGDSEIARKHAIKIEDLDLTSRTRNCLIDIARPPIRTVGDLVEHSGLTLCKIRNFGKTSLREIKRKLEELGLTLKSG